MANPAFGSAPRQDMICPAHGTLTLVCSYQTHAFFLSQLLEDRDRENEWKLWKLKFKG